MKIKFDSTQAFQLAVVCSITSLLAPSLPTPLRQIKMP
jgi:hypothetical protein